MKINELNHKKVLSILPDRKSETHKGHYGRILLLCGSRGYTGAAALAALGALRSGAGLVYLCVPESIYEIEASKLLEPIVIPMPDVNGKFSAGTIECLTEILPKMDAILIGSGMGISADTVSKLEQGRRSPSATMVCILANYYKTTADYILFGVDRDGYEGYEWIRELTVEKRRKVEMMIEDIRGLVE